ncbi:hypothetical protein MKW92_012299 [Papaver armeniacum]|nr:hypothetical protein MKW92_012299 [Papaver armeniacum]
MELNLNRPLAYVPLLLCIIFFIQSPIALCCHEHERTSLLTLKSFLTDPSNHPEKFVRNVASAVISTSSQSITARNGTLATIISTSSHPNRTALHGSLSPSLFNLVHLEYLDLSHNKLNFSNISSNQFSKLRNLTYLDLSHTMFSGSVTTQFVNLTSLSYLDISCSSSIMDYSAYSYNFNNSKVSFKYDNSYFSTSYVSSTSLNWLNGLVNLKVLRLIGVDLSMASSAMKWAEPLSFLYNLRELDLSDCSLSGLVFPVNEFLNLSRLESLRMGSNFFNSPIPVQFANFTSLSVLDLADQNLQGSIPHLPQLKELYVGVNPNLNVNLTWFFNQQWPELQVLSIHSTEVNGSIPSSISNASSLVSLHMYGCAIQGSLPDSISNLSQLQNLELDHNNIAGFIPPSISKLKKLQILSLTQNNLQGFIPESICEMSALSQINLGRNNLSGTIPSCIGKPRNLQKLQISGNSIGGSIALISLIKKLNLAWIRAIPSCIFELRNLSYLDLSKNNLQGTLPHSLNITLQFAFPTLNLANNKLRGHLPLPPQKIGVFDLSDRASIVKALGMSLYRTTNSGSIPSSMCANTHNSMMHLDLSNNELLETIPSSLRDCNSLISLNLGMNNFDRNIPHELERMKNLKTVLLDGNTLNGTFPTFIQQLKDLEVLNLGSNKFRGSIPNFIGTLRNLKIVVLRSNEFSGSIPLEITRLHKLQILDLSKNKLSGQIPSKIGNLEMLTRRPSNRILLGEEISFMYSGVKLQIVTKGTTQRLELVYSYNSGIDLSCNFLEGNIPMEMGLLKGLAVLNLIGSMRGPESLDLSFNKLFGNIPMSLTSIDPLGYLNLSYNNLSGTIPRGYHFDTLSLDGSAYTGNTLLCGFPTNKSCQDNVTSTVLDASQNDEDQENAREKWILCGVIALGYAVGVWGLIFVMLFRWDAYWRFIDIMVLRTAGCTTTKSPMII